VKHLYDVEFTAMCSPALLNAPGGLREPSDVLRFPLLMRHWDDWRKWLSTCNVEAPKRSAGIGLSDLILVQTAAIAGQGIMLGDETTCAGALASGQLVSPFSTTINSQRGYYLGRHRDKRASPATLAFMRWLTTLISPTGRQ
jgi:LysR family glycine cleavage system transcriptional activator